MTDKNATDTENKENKKENGRKLRRQLISAAVAVVALVALANGVPAPLPDNPVSRMASGVLTEVFNNRVADGIERVAEMTGDAIKKSREEHNSKQSGIATKPKKVQALKT
jgi:hypothetical protein